MPSHKVIVTTGPAAASRALKQSLAIDCVLHARRLFTVCCKYNLAENYYHMVHHHHHILLSFRSGQSRRGPGAKLCRRIRAKAGTILRKLTYLATIVGPPPGGAGGPSLGRLNVARDKENALFLLISRLPLSRMYPALSLLSREKHRLSKPAGMHGEHAICIAAKVAPSPVALLKACAPSMQPITSSTQSRTTNGGGDKRVRASPRFT